jgi:hypothetical protein
MSASTSTTFGTTIGSALGKSAAYAVHGVALSAQATGRFGADVVAGSSAAYTAKAAELKARREAAIAAHRAQAQAVPVAVKRGKAVPVAVKRGKAVPVSA